MAFCSHPPLLSSSQYSSSRDGCSRDHQYPVVELLDGRLWPVLLLAKVTPGPTPHTHNIIIVIFLWYHYIYLSPSSPDQHNLLFAAIPLVEFTGENRPPLVQV